MVSAFLFIILSINLFNWTASKKVAFGYNDKMNKKLFLVLNNIRSVHNVGSIFRTSDAVGLDKIYLTGHTPTPLDRFDRERSDLAKVALGAEKSVPWEFQDNISEVVEDLKKKGFEIVSLEQAENSIDYRSVKLEKDTALVLGSEVEGVSENILNKSDKVIEIPMKGEKESLNVSVAAGVALFSLLD